MDLGVARRAVRVEGWPELRYGVDIDACGVLAGAVSAVAPQAQERRRLLEQVVGHGSVRLVADRAVLRHRRMLVGERTLLLGMALVAQQVDGSALRFPSLCPCASWQSEQTILPSLIGWWEGRELAKIFGWHL